MTGDEESNILSCLLAKSLGVKETVARVNKAAYLPLVEAIGIAHSVSPRLSAVNSILQYIRQGKVLSSVSVGVHPFRPDRHPAAGSHCSAQPPREDEQA